MASLISLPMTAAQYSAARAALIANSQVISHTETTPESGSFATSQISMSYLYAAGSLVLTVLEKHGIAKFASLDTIKAKLQLLLTQLP
jgi:hypothetical protein